jgi:cell division protease FtsH
MEYETIDADQVDDLMNHRQVRQPRNWQKNDSDSNSGGDDASSAKSDATEDRPIGGPVEDA